MNSLISVTGKRIVITGAIGFLGLHLSRSLAHEGAVVLAVDISPKKVGAACLNDAGIKGEYFQSDITDERALQTLVKEILEKYSGVDVLINNAAFNPTVEGQKNTGTTFEDYPLEKWERELRVNLTGTMLMCRAMRPLMGPGASIVTIASIYGVVAPDQRMYPENFEKPAVYGASKAGVLNLTKYLATLWGKDGIRVNAVVYGGIENNQGDTFIRAYSAKTPLGRMAKLTETSGVIMFLASDASSYATGSEFTIDGGFTAW